MEGMHMKITRNEEILRSILPNRAEKGDKQVGTPFKTFLQESMGQGDVSNSVLQEPAQPPEFSPISISRGFTPVMCEPLERTEGFLGLIETYRDKLADPRIPLRDIQAIVREMELEVSALAPVLESIPDDDALKDILRQALTASTVEVVKFNRGDYVD
jgi:hypothetical protein